MSSATTLFKKEEKDLGRLSLDDFTYGTLGSAFSLSTGYVVMKSSEHLMRKWGLGSQESQSHFQFYTSLENISSGFLRGTLKSFVIFYGAVLIPVAEEWFFRDLMYTWQGAEDSKPEKASTKLYRVVSNGLIFGAFHFSLSNGWANILVVAVSTVAGIVFAMLRELRGDRHASTIAHSLNNSAVLFVNFLKI